MPRGLLLVSAFLHACFGSTLLRDGHDEAAVLTAVDSIDVASIDAEDIGYLVKRGWFSAARKVVTASHERGTITSQQTIATAVRRETEALKKNCDGLIQGLTVQKQVGHVNCAFQWAQNSSCIFLSIKFSHRWSSPGALELTNQIVNITNTSFTFSADGEHSGLRKRYGLAIRFHGIVDTNYVTWQNAAAGRMTALIPKELPGKWKQLQDAKDKPKNMAVWSELQEKWSEELKIFKSVSRSFMGGKSRSQGGDIPTFDLDQSDFDTIDRNGDFLASKYEMCEFAKIVTPLLFADKDSFPYVRAWDKDQDRKINATEWQGQGSLAESKLGITRQMFLAQVDAADKDKDGLVSFEDLRAAGFAIAASADNLSNVSADASNATLSVDLGSNGSADGFATPIDNAEGSGTDAVTFEHGEMSPV